MRKLALLICLVSGAAHAGRNGSGTYSLPAGNPVVTLTTISSTWANNTLGDLATEMTDSLSRSGKGTMLAPLQLANGTVGAPAWAFATETNTGFYRIGSHDIGFSINGSKAIEWTATTETSLLDFNVTAATTNQAGVTGTGNGTGPGAKFANGTAATGATPQDAVNLINGYLNLDGVVAPNSGVAIKNRLTPANFVRTWAVIALNQTVTPTLVAGFNIGAMTNDATNTGLTIPYVQAMASTSYVSHLTLGDDLGTSVMLPYVIGTFTGSTTVRIRLASTGVTQDCTGAATNGLHVYFQAMGVQ